MKNPQELRDGKKGVSSGGGLRKSIPGRGDSRGQVSEEGERRGFTGWSTVG